MRHFLFIFCFVFIVLSGGVVFAQTPSVSIITPEAGSTFTPGSPVTISWEVSGLSEGVPTRTVVRIPTRGAGYLNRIVSGTSYDWTIPSAFSPRVYTVEVRVLVRSGGSARIYTASRDIAVVRATSTGGGGGGGSTPTVSARGDVNGDGQVTDEDGLLALQFSAGNVTLTSDQQGRADVNGNGAVSSFDAALIRRKAAGLPPHPSCLDRMEFPVAYATPCLPVATRPTVQVWPGDTNNDGIVDERDVLKIGLYWNSRGPARSPVSSEWKAWNVEEWATAAATYADANGDGVIDDRDKEVITLNWHKTKIAAPVRPTVQVWPGDTNNDGVVDERDVLKIGLYWNSRGPARSPVSSEWKAWSVEEWATAAATYADANGDGVVDDRDKEAITLNWHKTRTSTSVRGDVNGDGVVNVLDITTLERRIRLAVLFDYDGNGSVGAGDAKILESVVAGTGSVPAGKIDDVDGNGTVNVLDITALERSVADLDFDGDGILGDGDVRALERIVAGTNQASLQQDVPERVVFVPVQRGSAKPQGFASVLKSIFWVLGN